MKLDKIKFARLIGWLERVHALNLQPGDIEQLDNIIDVEMPEAEAPIVVRPSNADVEHLMVLMAEGTRKIEAIKCHRIITGMGLKESKDAVERYWVSKPIMPIMPSNATLGDILEIAKSNLDVDNFGVRNVK